MIELTCGSSSGMIVPHETIPSVFAFLLNPGLFEWSTEQAVQKLKLPAGSLEVVGMMLIRLLQMRKND